MRFAKFLGIDEGGEMLLELRMVFVVTGSHRAPES